MASTLRQFFSSTPSTHSEGSRSVVPRRCTLKFVPSMYNAQYFASSGRVSHFGASTFICASDCDTVVCETSMPSSRSEIIASVRFDSPPM